MLVRRERCTVASSLVKSYPDEVRPNVVTTHQSAAQIPKRENMIKAASKNNLNTSHGGRWLAWPQSVVPLAVKLVAFDGQFGEFLV